MANAGAGVVMRTGIPLWTAKVTAARGGCEGKVRPRLRPGEEKSGGINLQADAPTQQQPDDPLYSARMLASRKPSVLTSISVKLLIIYFTPIVV